VEGWLVLNKSTLSNLPTIGVIQWLIVKNYLFSCLFSTSFI